MLKNKTVLITGAGNGLGQSMALRFAQAGAKVAVADMDINAAKATVQLIKPLRRKSLALEMDVTQESQVNDGIIKTLDKLGSLDIVISNAGIQHIDAVENLSFENWRKVLSVHLDGSFLVARAATQAMIKQQQGGTIIFMGSIHSKLASPLKAPYVSAKHGILGLARTLAKEGAQHNIRTNVICPGFVKTPLVEKQIPQQAKALGISEEDVIKNIMLKDTVDGEFSTVDDVANTAIFLAAFPTNALTGQSINVSHGWMMS